MLFLTCSWSLFGFHCNPSVVIPPSLSRDNGLLGFLKLLWNGIQECRVVCGPLPQCESCCLKQISCCTLIEFRWLKCRLGCHQHRNHCSTLEKPLVIDAFCHLLTSWGSVLPEMEQKKFHMLLCWVCTLVWVRQKNICMEFSVDHCLVDVQQSDDTSFQCQLWSTTDAFWISVQFSTCLVAQ